MPPPDGQANVLESLGAVALTGLRYVGGMSLLVGQTVRWTVLGLFSPKVRFGSASLSRQMLRIGLRSLAVVALVQGFIGVILVLQMTPPLKPWGQVDKVANIIGVAGFRMLGPIITAVVLSGFAGASIAAELGTMVVSEEVEALEAIALNPVRFLVVPRVWATLVVTVLLSVLADMMIAVGGYAAAIVIDAAPMQYWRHRREQLVYRDFFTGLVQAGVFGLLISFIACYEGLSVRGGAEGVGRATTMTVVYSIVAIVAASCVFTVVFYVFEL